MNQLLKRADEHLKKSEVLKIAFIRRLPPAISTIAANNSSSYSDLMKFALKCDELYEAEKSNSEKQVNNVSTAAKVEISNEGNEEEECPINAIRGNFRGRFRGNRGFPSRGYGRGSRGRSSRNSRPNSICVYHSQWGDEALKCLMPCSYPNNKFK